MKKILFVGLLAAFCSVFFGVFFSACSQTFLENFGDERGDKIYKPDRSKPVNNTFQG